MESYHMKRAQSPVGRRLPVHGDRRGEIGGEPTVLDPVARVWIMHDRRAGFDHKHDRSGHQVGLVELFNSLQCGHQFPLHGCVWDGAQIYQADVPA